MADAAFVITVVGTGMGILIGMGAIVIALFLHSQAELKDFHTRLLQQDHDFKSFMKVQEERRTRLIFKE